MNTPCVFLPNVTVSSNGYTGRHRSVWEAIHGPIPPFRDIDHLCHNEDVECPGGVECRHRACFNPSHYALATRRENVKRARTRRQLEADAVRARKRQQAFITEDKTERRCGCGAGPFVGSRGLEIHRSKHRRDAYVDTPGQVMCPCGAGPFKNVHGMNIHHAQTRCVAKEGL